MMKSFLLAAALVAGASAQLMVNTPSGTNSAAECEPFSITFSGGTPPYFLTVVTSPAGATPLASFVNVAASPQQWTVNTTVGASLLFNIRDSTGATATSGAFTVISGAGDSCLTAGGGAAPSDSGSAPPTTAGATSAPAASGGSATTPAATTPAASGASGASGASKAGSSTAAAKSSGASGSPTSSAGQAVAVPAGVLPAFAAVLGAALIAVLA